MRLLPSVAPWLALGSILLVALVTTLRTAFVVATGTLVGYVPAAVRAGRGSPEAGELLLQLVVVASIFVPLQMLDPFLTLCTSALARRVDARIQQRVMGILAAPATIAHLEDPVILDKVRDIQGINEGQYTPGGAVRSMFTTATLVLTVASQAVLVATFQWWLAAVLFGFFVVRRAAVLDDFFRTFSSGRNATQSMRRADYYRNLALAPQAAKELRIFGLSEWLRGCFWDDWTTGMSQVWSRANLRVLRWSLPSAALQALALSLVGQAGLRGSLSLGRVAIVAQASIGTSNVWASWHDMSAVYGSAAVPSLLELEALLQPHRWQTNAASEAVTRPVFRPAREIRFEDVKFRYPKGSSDVFSNLNLTIPVGKAVALVGLNGAGKTTLVKLLARLYEPSSGRITVDGVDIREFDPREWQATVAAIFEDFVRFDLPVVDNIGFGCVDRRDDRESLDRAARDAGASDLISSLPHGWDTVPSSGFAEGAELSGGQWQRVALARALFAAQSGRPILVLDEPTARLDVRAEAELFDRFVELCRGHTVLLISHRFSSVRHADLIIVLEGGQVVEAGSHAELVATCGRYARMFSLQARLFDGEGSAEEPGGVRTGTCGEA